MGPGATTESCQTREQAPEGPRTLTGTTARTRQVRIAVIGIALMVALGVLVRQTIGSGEPTATRGTAGGDDPVGQAGPGTPATRSGARLPAGPGAFDGFDRPGPDELGVADSGRAWRAALGTWGVESGRARLVAPEPGRFRSLAVIELEAPEVSVEVSATSVRPGCGLVFRYQNPLNYWFVAAVPDLATWAVGYVEEGTVTDVGNLGVVTTDPGTVIGIQLEGSRIEAFVDNERAASFDDPTLARETGAGLLAGGNTPGGARWDNFVATARSRAGTSGEPAPIVPDAAQE